MRYAASSMPSSTSSRLEESEWMSSGSMRSDEGLVQAGENVVDDLVALVLQLLDLRGRIRQVRIARLRARQQ